MKCFIHLGKDAVAVCCECGKAMCDDCSAYSNHIGICPECRLGEFRWELKFKTGELKRLKFKIVMGLVLTVLFFWALLPIFVGLFNFFERKKERKALEERINVLNTEINRLEKILNLRGGPAFV